MKAFLLYTGSHIAKSVLTGNFYAVDDAGRVDLNNSLSGSRLKYISDQFKVIPEMETKEFKFYKLLKKENHNQLNLFYE